MKEICIIVLILFLIGVFGKNSSSGSGVIVKPKTQTWSCTTIDE